MVCIENLKVISYEEFILINNALKEYNEMKQEIKALKI